MDKYANALERLDSNILDEQPVSIEIEIPQRSPRILVVDDDPSILKLLEKVISRHGYACNTADSIASARRLMQGERYDVMFLDLRLPDGSGTQLLTEKSSFPSSTVIVIITGVSDLEIVLEVVRKGAFDFITKPFSLSSFNERLGKVIEEWRSRVRVEYYHSNLEDLVNTLTQRLLVTSQKIDRIHDMTVAALGAAMDLRDPETEEHCRRVSINSLVLGEQMGLSASDLKKMKWSSYLHDIGKIGIPESILMKPGPLTDEEMEVVKKHPLLGFNIISTIDFLRDSTDVVLYHHERFDGSGYPHGLEGSDIPVSARIFAIFDAMDAMTTDRPYRKALPYDRFVEELRAKAGTHFDPQIVRKFLSLGRREWRMP